MKELQKALDDIEQRLKNKCPICSKKIVTIIDPQGESLDRCFDCYIKEIMEGSFVKGNERRQ